MNRKLCGSLSKTKVQGNSIGGSLIKFLKRNVLMLMCLMMVFSAEVFASSPFKLAKKEEASGNIERAYELASVALEEDPDSKKIKNFTEDLRSQLIRGYLSQISGLSVFALNERKKLYEEILQLNSNNELARNELDNINNILIGITNRIESLKNTKQVDKLKVLNDLQDYEGFVQPVDELKIDILENKSLLEAEIYDLYKENNVEGAYIGLVGAQETLKDRSFLKDLEEVILSGFERRWSAVAASYEEDNEKLALALFFRMLVYNLRGSGLSDEHVEKFLFEYTPDLILDFDATVSEENRNEFIDILKAYERIGVFSKVVKMEIGKSHKRTDTIFRIGFDDLSIRVTGSVDKGYSEYLAGYRDVPNPNYQYLVAQYTDALRQSQQAALNGAVNPSPVNSLVSGLASGNAKKHANALAVTPQFISEPVYQKYEYQRGEVKFGLKFRGSCSLLSKETQTVLKKIDLNSEDVESAIVIGGARPDDRFSLENVAMSEDEDKIRLKNYKRKKYIELATIIREVASDSYFYQAMAAKESGDINRSLDLTLAQLWLLALRSEKQPEKIINAIGLDPPRLTAITAFRAGNTSMNAVFDPKNTLHKILNDASSLNEFKSLIEATECWDGNDFFCKQNKLVSESKTAQVAIAQSFQEQAMQFFSAINKWNEPKKHLSLDPIEKSLNAVVVINGVGSGFLVKSNGFIITNYHVIEDANDVVVKLRSGKKYLADIVDKVESKDLALLRIHDDNLPYLRFANMNQTRVGAAVYALGSPGGPNDELLEQTVTKGIVSGYRQLPSPKNPLETTEFIQTDAAINPGNSGGPLIDDSGNVLGINTQKMSTVEIEGQGFAVSITEVHRAFNKHI